VSVTIRTYPELSDEVNEATAKQVH